MNKKLPYEEAFEQQMNGMPTPHEDESWQKMKQLLDDKEDRKTPVVWFKNYKVWGTVILLLLAGLWLIDNSTNSLKEEQLSEAQNKTIPQQNSAAEKQSTSSESQPKQESKPATSNSQTSVPVLKEDIGEGTTNKKITLTSSNTKVAVNNKSVVSTTVVSSRSTLKSRNNKSLDQQSNLPVGERAISLEKNGKAQIDATHIAEDTRGFKAEVLTVEPSHHAEDDSISIAKAASSDTSASGDIAIQQDPSPATKSTNKKTVSSYPATYTLSSGIGIQQQIPVGGQQAVHYGHNANSSTISDYIPSVYLRFQKKDKWYLQSGFSYGSPQLVKEFAYNKQTLSDALGTITTTTLRLKKTYYSEIPLSFNYYILPKWSAGVGGMYSWFHGAVTEKEILTRNLLTQSETIAKEIMPINNFTDSFLYKSHTYLLLQTDYNWRRLSVGLRYAKDMQPYIKYTLPDGTIMEQRNWSLEFVLRLRLWKGAKF